MQKLIVASNSVRRQQLMKEAGYTFEVKVLDVDESLEEPVNPAAVAQHLAERKNKAYREILEEEVVLTADTVVISKDEILGKPVSEEEAFQMIQSMSGATHEVISGVCLSSPQQKVSFSDTTLVTFEALAPEEINYYVQNYRPFDKAGSYGIQEWLGMIGIRSIRGSFYNVMGLPIHRVYQTLRNQFDICPIKI